MTVMNPDGSISPNQPRPPKPDPLDTVLVTVSTLVSKVLPPMEYIVEPWLPAKGSALIVGFRGTAKTWIGMTLARAVTRGEDFMGFPVTKPRRVLLVDAEMREDALQGRWKLVMHTTNKLLQIIHRQGLRDAGQPNMTINDLEGQRRIWELLKILEDRGEAPELIIFDSYTMFLTPDANTDSNDEARRVTGFIVELGLAGYAVVMTHHTGWDKTRGRGASALESWLDSTMILEGIPDPNVRGANIKLKFSKHRDLPGDHDPNTIYTLGVQADGELGWTMSTEPKGSVGPLLRAVHAGASDAEGVVDALGKSKPQVNRYIAKARKDGYLQDGTPLRLTADGEGFLGLDDQVEIPF